MDNQEMAVPFKKVQTGFGTRLNYHSVSSETGVMLTPNLHPLTILRMNGAIISIPPTRLHGVHCDFTIFIIANMLIDVYGDL